MKKISKEEALAMVSRQKESGLSVTFTSSVFIDILFCVHFSKDFPQQIVLLLL